METKIPEPCRKYIERNKRGMRLGGLGSTGYFGKHKDDEPEDR